jgi:hypothetical protein
LIVVEESNVNTVNTRAGRLIMSITADKPTGPAFVVFGIGADKKPRAARFDDSQPKLVAKAAELMNLKLREIRPVT